MAASSEIARVTARFGPRASAPTEPPETAEVSLHPRADPLALADGARQRQ